MTKAAMPAQGAIPIEVGQGGGSPAPKVSGMGRLTRAADAWRRRGSDRRYAERPVVRYGLAVAMVGAAEATALLIQSTTGRFLAFPFYAAVVGGAWFGPGPGCLALVLSAVLAADFWTPGFLDWSLTRNDLPSFVAFALFALMSLAWGWQRRRAQQVLERTVEERTADLVRANAALQVEIAEREAAEAERRRTEQALRDAETELARTLRLATVAELAATIAHEINQPLAAIVANGAACSRSLAQQPPLLDNAREAAGCIVADGHRAGDVIARIRALFNKEPPKRRLLDINDVIRQVLGLSRSGIERQRVTVKLELSTAPLLVMGDPVQLQQVLVNLFSNALDAMAETAERQAVLTVRSGVDGNGEINVAVADTGSGLDPELASRVFDGFYTTKPDGIGVGLAISRSIIEAHGGALWASPGDGVGATLGFRLPVPSSDAP